MAALSESGRVRLDFGQTDRGRLPSIIRSTGDFMPLPSENPSYLISGANRTQVAPREMKTVGRGPEWNELECCIRPAAVRCVHLFPSFAEEFLGCRYKDNLHVHGGEGHKR